MLGLRASWGQVLTSQREGPYLSSVLPALHNGFPRQLCKHGLLRNRVLVPSSRLWLPLIRLLSHIYTMRRWKELFPEAAAPPQDSLLWGDGRITGPVIILLSLAGKFPQ